MINFDESDEEDTLEPHEVQKLTSGLNKVLYSFLVMLDHHPLKRCPESLEQTIIELVELTHLETSIPNLDFNQRQRRSDLSALAYNAYSGLAKLCLPIHGSVSNISKLVFQNIMPGILMTHRGSSEVTPQGLKVIREHALHFVKHVMSQVIF